MDQLLSILLHYLTCWRLKLYVPPSLDLGLGKYKISHRYIIITQRHRQNCPTFDLFLISDRGYFLFRQSYIQWCYCILSDGQKCILRRNDIMMYLRIIYPSIMLLRSQMFYSMKCIIYTILPQREYRHLAWTCDVKKLCTALILSDLK